MIKVEDFIPHTSGYRRVAFEVLARALDDICPLENTNQDSEDAITAEEAAENIRNRIQRFEESEADLDKDWYLMERSAEKELHDLLKAREEALHRLSETYNAREVAERVKFYEDEMSKRISKTVSDINATREAYLKRAAKAKNRGRNFNRKTHNAKLAAFHKEIQDRTKKIKDRYAIIIENVRKTDNKSKVEARIKEAEGVWDRRYQRLKKKFMLREENHNHKRLEADSIRLSLDWFINDRDRVAYWCLLAGVSMDLCYTGVKKRLDLIGRTSMDLDKVYHEIKADGDVKANLGIGKPVIPLS